MKTIAIDTNVILTFRLKREPGFKKTEKLFKDCLDGKLKILLTNTTLLETEWVLRSVYKEPKAKIVKFFEELTRIDNLVTPDKSNVRVTLNLYKENSGVGFTDCVILVETKQQRPDKFLTFDKQLQKLYKAL